MSYFRVRVADTICGSFFIFGGLLDIVAVLDSRVRGLRSRQGLCANGAVKMVPSRFGPVDKRKNSAGTHSGSSRIINLEIAKDGILPSAIGVIRVGRN